MRWEKRDLSDIPMTPSGVGGCVGQVRWCYSEYGQFLEPRLIGKKIGASPLVVLLSFYLGVFAYGWKGVLFGPLSALLIYGIFREWQL